MRRNWSAFVAMFAVTALAACAGEGGQAGEETGADTTAQAPAQPTPPAGGTTAGNPPPGATPEMVAAGQQTFATVCAACHGPDAKGTQLAPNLTDSEWINTDGTYQGIITIVTNGVPQPKQYPSPMPPMGGANLNEQQIKDVAAYVWSLGGGK